MTHKEADDFDIWHMEMLLAKSSIGHRDPRTISPEEQAAVDKVMRLAKERRMLGTDTGEVPDWLP